jgi:ribosomal protein S18 acetylase RimI-like enzyme
MLSADQKRGFSDTNLLRLTPVGDSGEVDRQSIFALYKLSLHGYVSQTFGWDESFQKERFDVSYPDLISVDLESSTVGYVALRTSVEEIHLSLLILQPEYRNRGIGRKVMETLMARAVESNLPLTLSCFLCNEGAMRFYRELGFLLVRKDEHFADYRLPAL